jgi:alanyl-tRNA synthetase
MIEDAKASGATVLSGEDVFKLYDTFGFPIDLTREMAEEAGFGIDEDTFKALMKEQRDRARAARGNIGGWDSSDKEILAGINQTEFVGYGSTEGEAKVVAIIVDNMLVNEVSEGEFTLVLDKTPFYGEGGGQVGDSGIIKNDTFSAVVYDTKKTDGIYLHVCEITSGKVAVGDSIVAEVGEARRQAIMRNHSSLHLLQGALRQVLGTHVEQAGSYVDAERGRFDFTHFAAVSAEELARVEALVPTIRGGVDVEIDSSAKAYRMRVEIPSNTVAVVDLPASGKPVELKIDGKRVRFGLTKQGRVECGEIGSGEHTFELVYE